MSVKSVKCHPSGQKLHFLPSTAEILSQKCYVSNVILVDPHSTSTWHTVTNVVPLWSVYQAPSYEHNLTLLAWFLLEFAYLRIPFILQMSCSVVYLKNKWHPHISPLCDSMWYSVAVCHFTIVFSIPSAILWAWSHIDSTLSHKIGLFEHAIYSWDGHSADHL